MEKNTKAEKTIENLKKFFEANMQMKDELIELIPTNWDCYDEESLMKYTDKLYKSLKEFEIKFDEIADNFEFDDEIKEATKKFFERAKEAFELSKYEEWNVRQLYINKFVRMTPQLIENIKKECYGYTGLQDIPEVIENADSINELLHVYHSYIVNNEKILQATQIIDSKTNDINEPITLYGEESEISRKIYDEYPLDLDCGITDIVSMKDKTIIMVRDLGHALLIDIDNSQEKPFVKYNIPKICNRSMVEALPGINKKSITDNGASGMFETTKEDLTEKLFDFIGKVPTDADIVPRYNIQDLTRKFICGINYSDINECDLNPITTEKGKSIDGRGGISLND